MASIRSYKDLTEHVGKFLPLKHSGKVRDSFRLPGSAREKNLLILASDRASIFDFKLGGDIAGKGEVLNAFNIAARRTLKRHVPGYEDDLVAMGSDVDRYLDLGLQEDPELQRRAIVVREYPMVPIECVVRNCLTGSAYKAYAEGRAYCGQEFPPGMIEGDFFSHPVFTPTTKAEVGHDEPLDWREVENRFPGLTKTSLGIFLILKKISSDSALVPADTKFEFGYRQLDEAHFEYILCDEVFTPDSSRFWDFNEWLISQKNNRMPSSMDKQMLRDWGKTVGIDKLDPVDASDKKKVAQMIPPAEVQLELEQKTKILFKRLYGQTLSDFQQKVMGIKS